MDFNFLYPSKILDNSWNSILSSWYKLYHNKDTMYSTYYHCTFLLVAFIVLYQKVIYPPLC